ncbi:tetratricopeptide repeat protein [Neorhodopirellula lusitana]|uniref:tetratricopeptide repeat protein n=1 Tax=Neorhodopirellula lusitana TaxID=445327 RepID=UPI0038501404
MSRFTNSSQVEFEAGRFHTAIQFSQYAVSQNDEDADAWLVLGMSLIEISEWPDAIDALENASLLQPLDNLPRISLAIAYGAIGHRKLSRDLLMAVATSGTANADELLKIAAGLEAIDQPRLAMEACRQAGKQTPDASEIHYKMGYYAQKCGHPNSVSEALIRHAINLDPQNIHYRIGFASMLIRLGRQNEAITLVDHFIPAKLDEVTCACCLKRIANLFFDSDDIERARMCAERIAKLNESAQDSSRHSKTSAV